MEYRELILGCGNSRVRRVRGPNDPEGFHNPTTLDIDPNCGADIEWDLERVNLPFEDDAFDEIHAYDVLEHTGTQGDWRFFFAQFSEFWRILRPNGRMIGKSPSLASPWLWGDPGHKRVICAGTIAFLEQPAYVSEIGKTAMCDYRYFYKADFERVHQEDNVQGNFIFVLRAVKPSRVSV